MQESQSREAGSRERERESDSDYKGERELQHQKTIGYSINFQLTNIPGWRS